MSRHPLPVEVWDNVCHLLNNSDLKSLRGTCALVEKEVSRHLVHTIKIYTNSAGLDRLAGLSRERRLRKHVKAIQFDLAPPRSIWHSENPWLDDASTSAVTQSDDHNFSGNQTDPSTSHSLHHDPLRPDSTNLRLRDALGLFFEATSISIRAVDADRSHRANLNLWHGQHRKVLAQLLGIVHTMARPVKSLCIRSAYTSPVMFEDLFGCDYSVTRAIGREHDWIAEHAYFAQLPSIPNLFSQLRNLDLHLYDYGARASADVASLLHPLHTCRAALQGVSSELLSLKICISLIVDFRRWSPMRNSCMSHRGIPTSQSPLITWDTFFHGLEFSKLTEMSVQNLEYEPRVLGNFLRHHASTLKSLHVAQWNCDWTIPSRADLRTLADTAGDSLSLLTVQSVGDEYHGLCDRHNFRNGRLARQRCFYYEVNARTLTNLALNFDMSNDALRLAITHQVDLITSWDRDRIARVYDPNDRRSNLLPHEFDRLSASKHHTLKRQEEPAYRKFMSKMSDEKLHQYGVLKERLLREWRDMIDAGHNAVPRSVFEFRVSPRDLYVFKINGAEGLYSFTRHGFQHLLEVIVDGTRKRVSGRDRETDVLNSLLMEQRPHRTRKSYEDVEDTGLMEGEEFAGYKKVLEDVWWCAGLLYTKRKRSPHLGYWTPPNPWALPFEITVPQQDLCSSLDDIVDEERVDDVAVDRRIQQLRRLKL